MLSWSLWHRPPIIAETSWQGLSGSRSGTVDGDPAEIIVVDGPAPTGGESQKVLTREIASAAPDIRWEYVQAERRWSMPSGIRRSSWRPRISFFSSMTTR